MLEKTLMALALAAGILLADSCRMVEVASIPRNITIEIRAADLSRYRACLLNKSGEFAPVRPIGPGRYALSIPSMDGGYTQFGCVKYNKHIPEEYPVLRIMKGETVLRELSIRDIENLPAPDGAYRIDAD